MPVLALAWQHVCWLWWYSGVEIMCPCLNKMNTAPKHCKTNSRYCFYYTYFMQIKTDKIHFKTNKNRYKPKHITKLIARVWTRIVFVLKEIVHPLKNINIDWLFLCFRIFSGIKNYLNKSPYISTNIAWPWSPGHILYVIPNTSYIFNSSQLCWRDKNGTHPVLKKT